MNPARRAFLQRALAGVSVAALAGVAGCAGPPCDVSADADPDWAERSAEERTAAVVDAYFGDQRATAAEVGELVLAAQVEGADDDALDALQCELIEGSNNLGHALDAIDQARDDDFAKHSVVLLHGWVLSPTELLLCALSSRS